MSKGNRVELEHKVEELEKKIERLESERTKKGGKLKTVCKTLSAIAAVAKVAKMIIDALDDE